MDYNVFVTEDAERDLDQYLWYLLSEKKSEQAAANVLDDYQNTLDTLSHVAGSLTLCSNKKLADLGYHRINFLRHDYFMLYRIEGNTAVVDNIFHFAQDYESHLSARGILH